MLCGRCESSAYCSKACQKVDWPSHKLLCADVKHFADAACPSELHHRALLFKGDGQKPEFIWLKMDTRYGSYDDPHIRSIIWALDANGVKTPDYSLGYGHINTNPRTDKWGPHALRTYGCDNFLLDGTPRNTAAWAAAKSYRKGGKRYVRRGGNIVVTAAEWIKGPARSNVATDAEDSSSEEEHDDDDLGSEGTLTDVNMVDYRDVVDFLVWTGPPFEPGNLGRWRETAQFAAELKAARLSGQ